MFSAPDDVCIKWMVLTGNVLENGLCILSQIIENEVGLTIKTYLWTKNYVYFLYSYVPKNTQHSHYCKGEE